jgi:hypothetical protein
MVGQDSCADKIGPAKRSYRNLGMIHSETRNICMNTKSLTSVGIKTRFWLNTTGTSFSEHPGPDHPFCLFLDFESSMHAEPIHPKLCQPNPQSDAANQELICQRSFSFAPPIRDCLQIPAQQLIFHKTDCILPLWQIITPLA